MQIDKDIINDLEFWCDVMDYKLSIDYTTGIAHIMGCCFKGVWTQFDNVKLALQYIRG